MTPESTPRDREPDRLMRRLFVGGLFALTIGAFSFVAWGIIGLGIAMSLPENPGLALGYFQIALVQIGAIVGLIVGFVCGVIPRGHAIVRWLFAAAVMIGIALFINGGFAILMR